MPPQSWGESKQYSRYQPECLIETAIQVSNLGRLQSVRGFRAVGNSIHKHTCRRVCPIHNFVRSEFEGRISLYHTQPLRSTYLVSSEVLLRVNAAVDGCFVADAGVSRVSSYYRRARGRLTRLRSRSRNERPD